MYPIHENETGSFQELARSGDVGFGQISLLMINPGCARGGHYHTRKEEWFVCLHGKCELKLNNVRNGSKRTVFLEEANRELVAVKPNESHLLVNTSDSVECEVLIVISEAYNPEDPDTFKWDESKAAS